MPVSDYNDSKYLKVTSVSGTPTVSKAQPILLVDGSLYHNGNGYVRINFDNISDAQDIAFYDENDNLLNYEIETLDVSAGFGVAWVYSDYVRDDTRGARVAFGNNSANTDRQNVTGTWDNTGQAGPKVVHHLEENPNNGGSFDDSTSNNNDGTWNGNDNSNATGRFGDGQSFDGTDDNISFSSQSDVTTDDVTLVAWFKTPSSNNSPRAIFAYGDSSTANRVEFYPLGDGTFRVLVRSSGSNVVDLITSNSYDDDNWHQAVFTMDGTNEGTLYIDGSEPNLSSTTNSDNWTNDISGDDYWFIGAARVNNSDTDFYEGEIDEFRYYGTSWTANNPEKVQADYDASPAGGQVFFEQEMAESVKGGSVGFMREGRV